MSNWGKGVMSGDSSELERGLCGFVSGRGEVDSK